MNDERLGKAIGEFYRETDATPPDSKESAHQMATRLQRTPQLRRRRWLPSWRRALTPPPDSNHASDHQPARIPATNGHSPTVLGRTQSMFSPVKAITAGALVFALGGVLLIAQPFDQQGGSVPGAETTDQAAPVEFTGATIFGGRGAGPYWTDTIVEPFTDPRLAGEFRVWENNRAYPGGPTFWRNGFSIHDDDGGWIERPGLSIGHPDGTNATQVIIMDGHQAYEGLTLVAEVSLANSRRDWHGYIVDGELPPAPTIELPE